MVAPNGLTMRAGGTFRWYTMTELANFLNSRKQLNWQFLDTASW